MIVEIQIAQIRDNPWQPRADMDPAALQALAEDIKARRAADPNDPHRGLLQLPRVRAHPTDANRYQLVLGHRRIAALKLIGDTTAMVDRVEATDRQMSDDAASENGQRKDLSAVETARAIKRRIDEFGMSQLEAGRPFGIGSQGGVSNILRLLQLPSEIIDMVHRGELPERLARQLIPIGKINAKHALEIAQRASKAEPADRDEELSDGIEMYFRRNFALLRGDHFDLDWPAEPIRAIEPRTKGAPEMLPACKGCPFLTRVQGNDYCTRVECLQAKIVARNAANIEAASAKFKIPVAAAGEKTTAVSGDDYKLMEFCETVLALRPRPATLRLVAMKVPAKAVSHYDQFANTRTRVLGARWVMLATTNLEELKRLVKAGAPKDKARSTARTQSRYEIERTENRKLYNHMVDATAPAIAAKLSLPAAVRAAIVHSKIRYMPDKQKAAYPHDRAIGQWLIEHTCDINEWNVKPADARRALTKLASEVGAQLPAGWDTPPATKPAAKAKAKK